MPGPEHGGEYRYHDDDCRCVEGDQFCNRDGRCWSCCGAAKEDSVCTAPALHPTSPSHPCFMQTVARYDGPRTPVFRSNEEIARILEVFRNGGG